MRRRIETLTGLFSLCPRNWKGAITLCGDFFLRSRNAKSAMTEWFIFHELENKKARHGLGIDCFNPSQEMRKRGTVWGWTVSTRAKKLESEAQSGMDCFNPIQEFRKRGTVWG